MKGAMRCATTFAIVALLLSAVALPVHAATIIVTNTNDNGPGSLRQALAVAHDGDRITFAVSGTITLTSGGLVVARNVTISGPGANQLSIDGNHGGICVRSHPQKTGSISGLSIMNGQYGIWNRAQPLYMHYRGSRRDGRKVIVRFTGDAYRYLNNTAAIQELVKGALEATIRLHANKSTTVDYEIDGEIIEE
jgi:hypothetical protein